MPHAVEIKIDAREGALRKWFEEVPKKNVTIEQMDVGDILFVVDGVPALLIERKEANDFRGSVATNRFREQRSRMVDLMKEQPHLLTAFLFEGRFDKLYYNPNSRIQEITLRNLANDLGPKYGIGRLESIDLHDTLRLIGRYDNVYAEKGHPRDIADANSITESLSLGKKRGIDQESFAPCALSLIPGLTREAALSITAVYPTLLSLFSALESIDHERGREELLIGFEYGDGLRIGPTVAKRIYHFLLDVKEQPKKKHTRDRSPKRAKKKKQHSLSESDEENPFASPPPLAVPKRPTKRKTIVLPASESISDSSSDSEADRWIAQKRETLAARFSKR